MKMGSDTIIENGVRHDKMVNGVMVNGVRHDYYF